MYPDRQYDKCHSHPMQRFGNRRGDLCRQADGGLHGFGGNVRFTGDRYPVQRHRHRRWQRRDLQLHVPEQLCDDGHDNDHGATHDNHHGARRRRHRRGDHHHDCVSHAGGIHPGRWVDDGGDVR